MFKRDRSELSPDNLSSAKKQQTEEYRVDRMGDERMLVQMREMFYEFEKRIDNKLDHLASKEDLQQYREEVAEVKQQNEELKKMIGHLKECREKDRKQLERLDFSLRSKNLIFRGINHEANMDTCVRKILCDILQVKAVPGKTVSLHNRNGKATVRVEFGSSEDVQEVLNNTNKLKGTKIGVDRDLPESVRVVRAELLKIRKVIMRKISAMEPKNKKKVVVMNEKMKIEEAVFTIDRGELMCGAEKGVDKLNAIFKLDFSDLYIETNKFNFVGNVEMK